MGVEVIYLSGEVLIGTIASGCSSKTKKVSSGEFLSQQISFQGEDDSSVCGSRLNGGRRLPR